MTTEELLIPRYEVIADYPNNFFGKIGDIITPQSFESEDDFYDWELDKYPYLFRKLYWYEKRELNELPKYVRYMDGNLYKVIQWRHTISTNYIVANVLNRKYIIHLKHVILPATEQEYLTFQNSNK